MKETIQLAKQFIGLLDLGPYVQRAVRAGTLRPEQARDAEAQYRHFLLLAWSNARLGHNKEVLPTTLADAIWHQHILSTKDYPIFCNELAGKMTHHSPGLTAGRRDQALAHTRTLNNDSVGGSSGFCDDYLFILLATSDGSGGRGDSPDHHAPTPEHEPAAVHESGHGHHDTGHGHDSGGHSDSGGGGDSGGSDGGGGGCGGGD